MRVLRRMAEQKETGQVLVLVALGLLVLVGMVALAVDGGHVYRERRSMQNAADAGALAGAYELCHGDDSKAEGTAIDYATANINNEAHGAEVTITDDITVTVTVTESVPTFFARVLGFPEVEVQAEAAAICGKAFTGGLVWPIGYPIDSWTRECGQLVVLWAESDPAAVLADCGNGTDINELRCCKLYPVDLKNDNLYDPDPEDEREILTVGEAENEGDVCYPDPWPGTEDAWLDFSDVLLPDIVDPCDKEGGGTDELRWRIQGFNDSNEYDPPADCQSFIEMPSCAAQDTGTRIDAWRVADSRFGDIAGIPLYDPEYSSGGDEPCETTGGDWFQLEELGCIRVLGIYGMTTWKNTVGGVLKKNTPPSVKVIVGEIPCVEDENGGLTIRDPACDTLMGDAQPIPLEPGGFGAVSLVQ